MGGAPTATSTDCFGAPRPQAASTMQCRLLGSNCVCEIVNSNETSERGVKKKAGAHLLCLLQHNLQCSGVIDVLKAELRFGSPKVPICSLVL